jgi:hypothetical protein
MIERYRVQVVDVDEAVAELQKDDQAAIVSKREWDEIQVSFNDTDLDRLGRFIQWLRDNEFELTTRLVSESMTDRVYDVMCG